VLFRELGRTGPGRRSRLGCARWCCWSCRTAAGRQKRTSGPLGRRLPVGLSRLTPYVRHAHPPRMRAVPVASRRPRMIAADREGSPARRPFHRLSTGEGGCLRPCNAKPRAGCFVHLPLVNAAPTRGSNAPTVSRPPSVVNERNARAVDDDVHAVGTARGVVVDDARTTCELRWRPGRPSRDDLRKRRGRRVDTKKSGPTGRRGRSRAATGPTGRRIRNAAALPR